MEKTEIITTSRRYLGDADGVVFPDSQMERFFNRAVADYFHDTGFARGEFPLDIDSNGECPVPDDYCGIIVSYNDEGRRILASSISRVEDEYPTTEADGDHVEIIYRELSDDGKLRVSPIPEQEHVSHDQTLGATGYGMITQMYGCAFGFCPNGATVAWESIEDKGSVVYARAGDLAEITDSTAIVYHILTQAYSSDTDLANAKLSSAYASLYRGRVADRMTTHKGSSYSPRSGSFY